MEYLFIWRRKIIAFWSSLVKLNPGQSQFWTYQCPFTRLTTAHIASSKPSISLDDAVKTAEDTFEGTVVKRKDSDLAKYLGYLAKEDGSAVLMYVLVIINAVISRWLRAFVDAHSGHIVSIEDLVSHDSPHSITKFWPWLVTLFMNWSMRWNSR